MAFRAAPNKPNRLLKQRDSPPPPPLPTQTLLRIWKPSVFRLRYPCYIYLLIIKCLGFLFNIRNVNHYVMLTHVECSNRPFNVSGKRC